MSAKTHYSPLEYLISCKRIYESRKAHYQQKQTIAAGSKKKKKKPSSSSPSPPAKKKKKQFSFELADWPLRLSGLRVPTIGGGPDDLTWVTVLAQKQKKGVLRVVLYDVTRIEQAYEGLEDPYYTFDKAAAEKLSLKPDCLYTENPGRGSYDEIPLFHSDNRPVTDLFQRLSALRIRSNT